MFEIKTEQRTVQDKDGSPVVIDVVHLLFDGVGIALFKPSKTDTIDDLTTKAHQYIATHGYLAEWTRRINLGETISWSDEMRVD